MRESKLAYWNLISTALKSGLATYTLIFICLLGGNPGNAFADTSSGSPVLLTIRGNIEGPADKVVELDRETLTSFESTSIIATVPWLKSPTQFTGVRINTLLKSIGAKSNHFEAIAADDYNFTLRDLDFDKYPIIIAYEKDGEPLDARKLGPLLIMFPFDDFPELATERNQASAVWHLVEMKIL